MYGVMFTLSLLWNRLQMLREDDRGMTTEAMIVTALLAAGAVAAATVIMQKVTDKGEDIGDTIEGALAYF
ncbi:MAG TPA: hypothetical protein VFI47_16815 [Acidimicrobiales bacterium]|nr:hypothetical protein [Acidimicrobiales bacterium]